MKQRILPIAIVLMLAAAALFMPAGCAACGESDLSGHALVGGTWTSTQEGSWGQYVFRPDGTGNRGLGVQSETFTWSIPGAGRITINRDNARAGELRREQWNYSITDGVLNLESRQTDFNFTFNRVGGTETATTAPPAAGNEENDNEFALTAQEREFVGSWHGLRHLSGTIISTTTAPAAAAHRKKMKRLSGPQKKACF